MRNNATNIKREAKMLEESKVVERIKQNKNNLQICKKYNEMMRTARNHSKTRWDSHKM